MEYNNIDFGANKVKMFEAVRGELAGISRSLPRAQMGNGVHFVFFIDFVLLKGAESKTID